MRLIDADELKEKLLKIQADIVDKKVARGSSKSDAWIAAYLLILDEYIKMIDEMPSATQHYDCNHDCDAIYEAYNRGYSKGFLKGKENVLIAEECMKQYRDINKKMEEQAKRQMEDYCENDCDATYNAWHGIYRTLHHYSKEKHNDCIKEHGNDSSNNKETKIKFIEAIDMTRKEIWDKVIQNLKILDQEAHSEEFVPLITAKLVMTACELRTDIIHGTIKQEDKSNMWSLVDDLGRYSIKGETIMYLPEYQDLIELMRKVL